MFQCFSVSVFLCIIVCVRVSPWQGVVSVFECFSVSGFKWFSVSVVQCPVFQCFRVSVFQWVSVSVFQCFSVSGFVATVLVVLNKGNDVTVDQSMLAACTNMHLYSRVFLFWGFALCQRPPFLYPHAKSL